MSERNFALFPDEMVDEVLGYVTGEAGALELSGIVPCPQGPATAPLESVLTWANPILQ